jgi:hypothetical protein
LLSIEAVRGGVHKLQKEKSVKHLLNGLMLTIVASAGPVSAQDPANYQGVWKGELQGATRPVEVRVVIEGTGGTWDTISRSRSDPCVGLKAPIAVTLATAQALEFEIKASDALAGCHNTKAALQRIDDKTLKGTRGKQALSLQRE